MKVDTLSSGFSELLNEDITVSQEKWSAPKKIISLFFLSYVFFYMFPYPISEIPFIKDIIGLYSKAIENITLILGHNILGLNFEKIEMTGSGDTTFDYVSLVTISLLALIVSLGVFILTRKQKNYSRLYNYIIVYARYYLALYMLSYGFAKVVGGQFITPGFWQLEKTYGNSTPMNLLWTFMGYSKTYTIFSGFGEILGGILLFFRRTTVMGCLVTIAIMLNVVMLNFSYDVPVKLFSCHLVLIAIFIVSPFIKKLIDFFIFQRTSNLHFKKIEFTKKWTKITRIAVKTLIILCFPGFMIIENIDNIRQYESKGSFNGMYITQTFFRAKIPETTAAINRDTLVSTQLPRWEKITFQYNTAIINTGADYPIKYSFKLDSIIHKLILSTIHIRSTDYILDCKFPNDNLMVLSGNYQGDSVYAVMKKKDLSEYTLMNRGFHWINEYPYNR